jgi:hypothetical protein
VSELKKKIKNYNNNNNNKETGNSFKLSKNHLIFKRKSCFIKLKQTQP